MKTINAKTALTAPFVAGVLALTLFSGFAQSAPPNEPKILHARFVGPGGVIAAEEYLDPRTNATRLVEREPGPARVEHVTVREASRIVSWYTDGSSDVYEQRVLDPRDPWLENSSLLLRPSRMLAAGRARAIGRGAVDGRAVTTLEVSSDGHDGETRVVVDVDRETDLPVRYTVTAGSQTTTIDVETEELPLSTLSPALFETERTPTMSDRRVAYSELSAAVPFPVLTLGEAYRGVRFGATNLRQRKFEPGMPFQPKPELVVGYVRGSPFADPAVSLIQHQAGTEDANRRLAAFRAEGEARTAVINGAERTVYLLDADRRPVYFATVVDGTLVHGSADVSADEVVALLSALRPA